MKLARRLFLGLGLFAAALPLRADAGPTVLAKGLFSFQAPPGWTVREIATSPFPVAVAPSSTGMPANLNAALDQTAVPMSAYIAESIENLKKLTLIRDVKVVSEDAFTTTAGLSGERVVVTDTVPQLNNARVQQAFYYFDGGADHKLVITASCAAADSAADLPLFDAAVKSLTLE